MTCDNHVGKAFSGDAAVSKTAERGSIPRADAKDATQGATALHNLPSPPAVSPSLGTAGFFRKAIILSWPPAALSPNAKRRGHWRAYAPVTKAYRHDCAVDALAQGLRACPDVPLHLSLTFCPPDNRKRDLDGMLGAFKAGLDGLSDVLGVDDSRWSLSIRKGEKAKGGLVLVTITTAGASE